MADYKDVLAELRANQTAVKREQDRLDTAISAIEDLVPDQAMQPDDKPQVSPRAFSGLSMPKAIEKCLRLAGCPMMKLKIQDTLRAGGVRAGKSFSPHVYNTLKRLSKDGGPFYRKMNGGPWGLSEWQSTGVPPRTSATTTGKAT